ncbi:unnamed protein product [Microthlaspi erraticum]|uniref:S-protein homolog n=1 Tax=Microthlaspi erraticum TaxID=1685480 RepID=A0A6D2JN70_9BRAS|nr:unnamed protein product [Microthlaspi erraticum]
MIDNAYGLKTTVLIRNGLDHKKWLKVHCKSKDDNLGDKYLGPGKDYHFNFSDNFWGTTRFGCTLSKGPDYKISKTFDAYVQDGTKPHGGSYNYIAKDDGIYHNTLVKFKLQKLYDWQ